MDASTASLITGLVSGLGIGAVITALVQHSLKDREAARESQRKDLEARYRVVILLMYAAVDFEKNRAHFRINRPDLTSRELVVEELQAEWYNMTLFASSATLKALRSFIAKPTTEALFVAAQAMRADLGRGSVIVEAP